MIRSVTTKVLCGRCLLAGLRLLSTARVIRWQAIRQRCSTVLTAAQDFGAVTELLSGAFFEPFGRSTSRQLWSSAMVVTPLLRGLFGIDVDALHHTIKVTPHLPASWPSAVVNRLRVGESVVNLSYKRDGSAMVVSVDTLTGPPVHLAGGATSTRVALPGVEVEIPHGLPLRGARTAQLKVIGEEISARSIRLEIEGMGGWRPHLHWSAMILPQSRVPKAVMLLVINCTCIFRQVRGT